jgi:hypothetical protein
MDLKAGRCGLIIDGIAVARFSCAFELADETETFGFLSGPIDHLQAAQKANWVQIDFGDGQIAEIRVLQVSSTGIALISVRVAESP